MKVYFSLGSNVGGRQKYLSDAVDSLKQQISELEVSSFYQTEPWGNKDQPYFLNICVSGNTDLSPGELLEFIKSVESKLGRKHTEKWGPREIDIDILFYGSELIELPDIKIPHEYLAERAFVLIPLAEIAPDIIHPVLKESISDLSKKVDSSGIERLV